MGMRTFGIASILKMKNTGTHGGTTVKTTRMTAGTALTTSDRVRNSSTLQKETSGQVQTMMTMAMAAMIMISTTRYLQ